jgi:hypothetical protein
MNRKSGGMAKCRKLPSTFGTLSVFNFLYVYFYNNLPISGYQSMISIMVFMLSSNKITSSAQTTT